ncbi:alpha/beta hydrolase [Streptomyces sp. NPDC086777]|uniref:alpha/beta hydrolase n=1 Tax=Streptomyces sp. NPDC086777 TaxID=3154866 RepID=UPI003450044B
MTDPSAEEAASVDPGRSGTLHPFVVGNRAAAAVLPAPPYEPPTPVGIRDVSVPGPDGAPDVRVRVFTPAGHEGKLPGLLFLHGGGFILGLVDFFDSQTTRIAAEVGAVVVSVDYRVAPEAPFPAGMEDCYAALEWMVEHADELGVDPQRIGIAGESAGANLAAAVALAARDGNGPRLTMQYLGLPMLDDRLETPSMNTFVDTPGFNGRTAGVLWDSYLGGAKTGRGDDVSPYAAPARAEDLAGLPPTYIALAEFDPLRDEGFEYARRLIAAGVPTELRHFPGASHGVSELNPGAEVSRRMIAGQLDALRRGLHGDVSGPSV